MICKKCFQNFAPGCPRSIDVDRNPELKSSVKDGSMFVCRCPHCGNATLSDEDFLYHEPSKRLLIVMSRSGISAEGLEGYTLRRVESVGELVEKVNIFDAGLDDVAMELCKYLLSKEINKDVPLKFYKMSGSDGEMTFAYPENGEMQMIEIGYRFYSDAAGIVSRNPAISGAAEGLTKVDQDFILGFFR